MPGKKKKSPKAVGKNISGGAVFKADSERVSTSSEDAIITAGEGGVNISTSNPNIINPAGASDELSRKGGESGVVAPIITTAGASPRLSRKGGLGDVVAPSTITNPAGASAELSRKGGEAGVVAPIITDDPPQRLSRKGGRCSGEANPSLAGGRLPDLVREDSSDGLSSSANIINPAAASSSGLSREGGPAACAASSGSNIVADALPKLTRKGGKGGAKAVITPDAFRLPFAGRQSAPSVCSVTTVDSDEQLEGGSDDDARMQRKKEKERAKKQKRKRRRDSAPSNSSSSIVTPDPKRSASSDRHVASTSAEEQEKSDLEDDDVMQLSQDIANAALSEQESAPVPPKQLKGRDGGREGSSHESGPRKVPTYAEKTAKPRQRELFLLYVQSGQDKRLPIAKAEWERVVQVVTVKVAEHWMAGGSTVFINWNGFKSERGLIACADENTSSWVRKTVADIKIGGKSFRAWRRNEYGDRKVMLAFCEPFYKALSGESLLSMIKKLEPSLDPATFLSWTGLAKGGFLLRVLVDKATEIKILERGAIRLPTGSELRFQSSKSGEDPPAVTSTPKPRELQPENQPHQRPGRRPGAQPPPKGPSRPRGHPPSPSSTVPTPIQVTEPE